MPSILLEVCCHIQNFCANFCIGQVFNDDQPYPREFEGEFESDPRKIVDIPTLYRRFSLEFWVLPTGMCSDSSGCSLLSLKGQSSTNAEVLMTTSKSGGEKAELKFRYTTTKQVKPDRGEITSSGQLVTAPISIQLNGNEYTKIGIKLAYDGTVFNLNIEKDGGLNTDGSSNKASVKYPVPCIHDNVLLKDVKLEAGGSLVKALLKDIKFSTDSCLHAQKWNPDTNACENKGGLIGECNS